MKKLFRKAVTVLGSAAMIGATVGMAAAAAYPEPFTSNTAIVVGANAAPSDNIAAASIASNLDANAAGTGSVTVEGGEVFDLFDSDKLHFGSALNTAISSDIDDGDMTVLADGEYDDGSIDVDYEQKITLGSQTLELIADSDLNDEEPTLGYHFDDAEVLTYKLLLKGDGAKMQHASDTTTDGMKGTDLPLFGKDYFVLDATDSKITLLNSAEKTVIAEGETVTIDGHTVSIEYIEDGEAKFNVNGEITDKLADGESYELSDEYHIVLSESLYASKDTGISKAEISIGSGKVVLETGNEVEVNDDSVDGLTATFITSGTGLDTMLTEIALKWETDGEVFLTEGTSIEMPVFKEFGVIFNGLDFGDKSEKISIDNGETLTLNMENFDVDLMFSDDDSTYVLGDNEAELKMPEEGSAASASAVTYYLAKDERFLAVKLDSDLSDVDQAYYEVQSLNNDTDEFDLKLNDLTDDDKDIEFVDAQADDDEDKGDINVKVLAVFDSGDVVPAAYNTTASVADGYTQSSDATALMDFAVIEVNSGSNTLHFDKVVSKEGMIVQIPTTAGKTQMINFFETADDGDLANSFDAADVTFNATVDYDSDDDVFAKYAAHADLTMVDETADDKEVGYTTTIHASKVMTDSDSHTYEVEYYGAEVTADLKLVAGGESSTTTDAGVMTVKDAEASTVAGKNLVVVGGSAINSVAAELLGGAYSEAMFTSATGVGAGEFLIESFDRAGKTALLVAGYNAADTEKAVTYLLNNDVDTTVGMKMKGTSATEATVVTA